MKEYALVGNPNTGKTSLFNQLTGSYEYVGNWSGVTVDKKIGALRNKKGKLIDLPGVYSLTPLSKDETVVTDFLLQDSFAEIINIVDASQLERNLLLTIQLLEFGKPITVGLNMIDVASKRGIVIDSARLSYRLGIPIIPIVARTGDGCSTLGSSLEERHSEQDLLYIDYGEAIEKGIRLFERLIENKNAAITQKRWLAIQFFEGNQRVRKYVKEILTENDNKRLEEFVQTHSGSNDFSQAIYVSRKEFIEEVISDSVERSTAPRVPLTDKIDKIVTNKFLGIPIFLGCMYLMFMLTFDWLGSPLSDVLDGFFSAYLADWVNTLLTIVGTSEFINSLIIEGIIAGVGGVLVFVPQIFILFFFISLLEDSGYMARVALVMDRMMEKIGLNGKAFIPLIIGFGCNVPGVMASRTIEQPKERLLTVLLTPLMSCSARLPVYALFVGAFFIKFQALAVLAMYVLGIVVAFILAKVFSKTILKGETSIFVIELPPYRMPDYRTLMKGTWDKGKGFLKKAGTFIFGGSVFIWFLSYAGPSGFHVDMDKSFLALIGGVFAPILEPVGFGTWQAGASLLTGFMAKEVVVSTMNIIYHVPNMETLQGLMATEFSALSSLSFMVFILLYIPCLATVATINKETGSARWTVFSIGYSLLIAYLISFALYQVGSFLGF